MNSKHHFTIHPSPEMEKKSMDVIIWCCLYWIKRNLLIDSYTYTSTFIYTTVLQFK